MDASPEKLEMRLHDNAAGKAISIAADYEGEPAGYVSVYPYCMNGALGGKGLPEIVDFNVLEKFRNRGVGTKLMDIAEQIAAEYSDTVYLGVGLHSGYGAAQRIYVKRGYIPDGSGVWYGDKVCNPYSACVNDDDLNLYLYKKLK
ncbi:MAG: GNAT family N-acetyltransferase [Oscillospiraceae bacterium]